MKGFTTTNSIKLKKGVESSSPFIKLKSFTFNESAKRIDCHILVCESSDKFKGNETKIKNIKDAEKSIVNIKESLKIEASKHKGKKYIKKEAKKIASKILAMREGVHSKSKELISLPRPEDIFTNQYPCFYSEVELTETQVYDLIKSQYKGVSTVK